MCAICAEEREDNRHSFLHCGRVYKMWARLAWIWGLNFVGLGDKGTNFDVWVHIMLWGTKMII